jgi:hypothetical protein
MTLFGIINKTPKTIAELDAIINDFIDLVDHYNDKLNLLNELKDRMNILEKDANSYELILYDLKYGA